MLSANPNKLRRISRLQGIILLLCLAAATRVCAEGAASRSFQDSTELTLDQLVNLQVTSGPRKETDLTLSPAAISVLTEDDICRLGISSIPEALRLVPGMDVAQVSG